MHLRSIHHLAPRHPQCVHAAQSKSLARLRGPVSPTPLASSWRLLFRRGRNARLSTVSRAPSLGLEHPRLRRPATRRQRQPLPVQAHQSALVDVQRLCQVCVRHACKLGGDNGQCLLRELTKTSVCRTRNEWGGGGGGPVPTPAGGPTGRAGVRIPQTARSSTPGPIVAPAATQAARSHQRRQPAAPVTPPVGGHTHGLSDAPTSRPYPASNASAGLHDS